MIGGSCDILVTSGDHQRIMEHLFPGDQDEHGAILRAGIVRSGSSLRLLIQHVYPAEFGTDYVAGKYGYRALTPTLIHREILRCRDAGLAYLAVHNHGSDRRASSAESTSSRMSEVIPRFSILAAVSRLVRWCTAVARSLPISGCRMAAVERSGPIA